MKSLRRCRGSVLPREDIFEKRNDGITVDPVGKMGPEPVPYRCGDVPGGVMRLIAGMCLLDAAWVASTGALLAAAVATAGLPATRLLQRRVAGS